MQSLRDDNSFSRGLFTLSDLSLEMSIYWVLNPAVSLQYFPVDYCIPFNVLGLKFIHSPTNLFLFCRSYF